MRPDTYYASRIPQPERPRLTGIEETETAVVGGGLAGLTTALALARAGQNVTVIEAEQLGFGASGRNGGIVSPGFANGAEAIARRVGQEAAHKLHQLSIEGVDRVRKTIRDLNIPEAASAPGLLDLRRHDRSDDLREWVADWSEHYGYEMRYLDRAAIRERLATDRYLHGVEDPQALHINPLAYLHGIAKEIENLGGRIFETSPVTSHDLGTVKRLKTAEGLLHAKRVVFAMGGYTTRLVPALKRAILPIATYMIETEPSAALAEAIRTSAALADDRRAGDYYRLVDGGQRLLWGGRISTRDASPAGVAKSLRAAIHEVFPQLDGVSIARAWSGWMGYARHQMPQIGRLGPGEWHITAFGGHGLNTTAVAGEVLAEAILGASDRISHFAPWGLSWAGGPFGLLAAQATYGWLSTQDRWQERHA